REMVDLESADATYWIRKRKTPLNPVEALAVHTATRLLIHHAQVNEDNYLTALEKLAAMLPEPARSSADQSIEALETKSTEFSRHLDQVARAWFEQTVLLFDYLSPSSSSGTAHPQELEVYFVEIS